jgi:hypothetical protein
MATPPVINIITVASAAADVTPSDLAAAIATLQVTAAASHERAVGAIIAAGAPAGTATHPHRSVGPLSIAAGASAPIGPAAGSLATTAVVSALAGTGTSTAASHPPDGLFFLTADTSTPAGPAAGVAGPLDAAIAGTPAGTVAGATGP